MVIGDEYVEVVKKWQILKIMKEVEKCLGFVNYYRVFIKNYVKIVGFLNRLMGKQLFIWGNE